MPGPYHTASDPSDAGSQPSDLDVRPAIPATDPAPAPAVSVSSPTGVSTSDADVHSASQSGSCSCDECASSKQPQLVYAIGQLGYDFGSDVRRASLQQQMPEGTNPHDALQLLAHLEEQPWNAAAILWTLNMDATPIYAIQPNGPFSDDTYQRLREFLGEQVRREVECVSIPGLITGSARLANGHVVPLVWPALRGMFSWTTTALIGAAAGPAPPQSAKQAAREAYAEKVARTRNFLDRVYYELRLLGVAAQDRAINFAATNAFNVQQIFEDAVKENMELDRIDVERSPTGPVGGDSWDVVLAFFKPDTTMQPRKIYRFTVNVSDVVPVTVGPVRSWWSR
jgi:cyanobactin maturation PatA/PatG family protease